MERAHERRLDPPELDDVARRRRGELGDQRDADARTQRALRRALGELMQQQGDLTGQVPPALGEADNAMREAGQALGLGTRLLA